MLLTWRDGRTAGPLRLDDAMAADGGIRDLGGEQALYTPGSYIAPKNRQSQKRKLIFQTIIFQVRDVKFWGCI